MASATTQDASTLECLRCGGSCLKIHGSQFDSITGSTIYCSCLYVVFIFSGIAYPKCTDMYSIHVPHTLNSSGRMHFIFISFWHERMFFGFLFRTPPVRKNIDMWSRYSSIVELENWYKNHAFIRLYLRFEAVRKLNVLYFGEFAVVHRPGQMCLPRTEVPFENHCCVAEKCFSNRLLCIHAWACPHSLLILFLIFAHYSANNFHISIACCKERIHSVWRTPLSYPHPFVMDTYTYLTLRTNWPSFMRSQTDECTCPIFFLKLMVRVKQTVG